MSRRHTADERKPDKKKAAAKPAKAEALADQTRKVLGKHYANKYHTKKR